MESKSDKTKGHDRQQTVAKRLTSDGCEGGPKAVRVVGVAMEAGNQNEDPNNPEDDASRDHAKASEPINSDPFCARHRHRRYRRHRRRAACPIRWPGLRAIAGVAGRCLRLDAPTFLEWADRCPAFQRLVDSYTQALFGQIALSAACNRLHSNDARLARWLLMTQDRLGSVFPITQDFLGQLLGVRRSTVSGSATLLQRGGAIRYTRGRVTIVDRALLEMMSCECYATITSEL